MISGVRPGSAMRSETDALPSRCPTSVKRISILPVGFTRTRNKGKSNVIDMIQKYIESKGMPIENWDITVGYCTNLEEAEKYRDDVEAQLGVKLLERREDFKTRISIISGCHTGPYALGIACIPKYTTIRL